MSSHDPSSSTSGGLASLGRTTTLRIEQTDPRLLRVAVVALLLLMGAAMLAVPAAVTSSPSIANAWGFGTARTVTVHGHEPVDVSSRWALDSGRLRRTDCAGAVYRVRWGGGDGTVRHCWDDVKKSARADAWLADPVTGELARDAFDGWNRNGTMIALVESPSGDRELTSALTAGRLAGEIAYVVFLLALAAGAGWAAFVLGRTADRVDRRAARTSGVPN